MDANLAPDGCYQIGGGIDRFVLAVTIAYAQDLASLVGKSGVVVVVVIVVVVVVVVVVVGGGGAVVVIIIIIHCFAEEMKFDSFTQCRFRIM